MDRDHHNRVLDNFYVFLAFSSCPPKWKTPSIFVFSATMNFGPEFLKNITLFKLYITLSSLSRDQKSF